MDSGRGGGTVLGGAPGKCPLFLNPNVDSFAKKVSYSQCIYAKYISKYIQVYMHIYTA